MSLTFDGVSFDVSPEAYTRFMGRYSERLSSSFARLARVRSGQRVLDVGCGPGAVAACVWDYAGGRGPLSAFWRAARELDPLACDESRLAGVREGHLAQLFGQAGLAVTGTTALTVRVRYATFGEWWEPLTLGVGPAGSYIASLPGQQRAALRDRCRQEMVPPFEVSATAWQ